MTTPYLKIPSLAAPVVNQLAFVPVKATDRERWLSRLRDVHHSLMVAACNEQDNAARYWEEFGSSPFVTETYQRARELVELFDVCARLRSDAEAMVR